MKSVAAIVEPAAFNADLVAEHIIVALADLKSIENKIVRVRGQLEDALGAAKARRLDIGRWLSQARAAWPERGPNAKGWGEFCARVKIPESTARMYIAEYRDPKGFAERAGSQRKENEPGPEGDKPANVYGGSGEHARGTFCTPKKYADAIGAWDLDPFSNPRSHIAAAVRCMLEDGGDGLVEGEPGSYRTGGEVTRVQLIAVASASTRVFLQPPYSHGFVDRVVGHYGHTRFCALLRFAPDTRWFKRMWPRVRAIAIPLERLPFETPEGVRVEGADEGEDAGAPFPHVFYYADERDVTDAIRALCIVLRVEHPNT